VLERLRNAFEKLRKDADFEGALREVQRALIAADVDLTIIKELTEKLRKEYKSTKLPPGLSKKDYILRKMYEELLHILGEGREFPLVPQRILLVGLFGSGKTTTAAKLGKWLAKRGLSVLLVEADTHRPAAFEQMEQLAKKAGVRFFNERADDPAVIVQRALRENADVYIVDTAGRSALDEELMSELKRIKNILIPEKTLLVVSADAGSAVGKEAEAFQKEIGIDGVIITKMDSSGKGGGALTACAKAGVPVYFIGTGEHIEDFEAFDPQRFLGRILGVPDISALLERVKETEAEKLAEDLLEGPFDINAFHKQLEATAKMGPLDKVLSMLGMSPPKEVIEEAQKKFKKYDAIYKSMTKYERAHPEVLKDPSRIRRIAKGSGTSEEDVRAFLRDYWRAEKLFRKIKRRRRYIEKLIEKGKFPVIR